MHASFIFIIFSFIKSFKPCIIIYTDTCETYLFFFHPLYVQFSYMLSLALHLADDTNTNSTMYKTYSKSQL